MLLFLFFLTGAAILLCPKAALACARSGLDIWFSKMIPTLFPFMVLSGLMLRLALSDSFARLFSPLLYPLLRQNNHCLYCVVIGFLCGFPMGAKITADMYRMGKLTRREADLLLAFCNNIGPVFFTGFVLDFLPRQIPVAFYLFGMYGLPLCYGIFLCRQLPRQSTAFTSHFPITQKPPAFGDALDQSVVSAVESMTKLGGYMIFFNLLNLLPLLLLPALPDTYGILQVPLRLFLEITGGISYAGKAHPLSILTLLPFGGLSCIAQTGSMISGTDLSLTAYVLHKIVQSVLAFIYYSLCFHFFL